MLGHYSHGRTFIHSMKVLLVTGSRSITSTRVVDYVLCQVEHDLGGIDVLLHGGAIGVDLVADEWARGRRIPVQSMAADLATLPYKTHGSRAYVERDRAMVDRALHVVAIWDGTSTGTKQTLEHARAKGKLHSVWPLREVLEEIGNGEIYQ